MKYSGVKNFSLVELVDIYPTLAELCGLATPTEVQGTSLVPIINDPNLKWKEGAFSSFPRVNGKVMGKTIRTKEFRYTEYRDTANGRILDQELYDISRDPFQKENLIKQQKYKKVVENHQALLQKGWRYIASEIKR